MRIIHMADIHFGQQIYQHYDRQDEHLHFFDQLKKWIREHQPDALIISGDIFDVAQPSAAVWTAFNNQIVELRNMFPSLAIVIVAGNHDSASRIESHSKVWEIGGVTIVGTPPPLLQGASEGWEDRFVVHIPSKGYIIAVPYSSGDRSESMIHLQKYVEAINTANLPVVMTGHLTATGTDPNDKDMEAGNLRPVSIERFGDGYDYLALGHIHRAQTLNETPFYDENIRTYTSPVARYSGSVLHVSESETHPHSVSLVDIERRAGKIEIRQLIIDQLRQFLNLTPEREKYFESAKEALAYLKKFIKQTDHAYFRFKFIQDSDIPADFNTTVYSMIEESGKDLRYNPRIFFVPKPENIIQTENLRPQFDVEVLKQMTDPLEFVRDTAEAYVGLSEEDLIELFGEVEEELIKTQEGN